MSTFFHIDQFLCLSPQPAEGNKFLHALREVLPSARYNFSNDRRALPGGARPDMIFLDAANGKDTARWLELIREDESLRDIPVIVSGKNCTAIQIATAYSLGASLYFRTPSSYGLLVLGLEKVLEGAWVQPHTSLSGLYPMMQQQHAGQSS